MATKIKMRDCPGYYSKLVQVQVPGTKDQVGFKIRELPDDLRDQIRKASRKMLQDLRDAGLDTASLQGLTGLDTAARRQALDDMLSDLMASMLQDDQLIDRIEAAQERDDKQMIAVVSAGLVEFPPEIETVDAEGNPAHPDEVTPEAVAKLPRWLQVALQEIILNDSGLSEGEASFLERSLLG